MPNSSSHKNVEAELVALADCNGCPFAGSPNIFGVGTSGGIAFVGMNPGIEELRKGEPFVGKSGKLFNAVLLSLGIRREDTWVTNAALCAHARGPSAETDKDRKDAIQRCSKRLARELEIIQPKIIVALGTLAANIICGDSIPGITKSRGAVWPSSLVPGRPVIPTYHPAHILRGGAGDSTRDEHSGDIDIFAFEADIKHAHELVLGTPIPGVPEHVCHICWDVQPAVQRLQTLHRRARNEGFVAVDVEAAGVMVGHNLDVRRQNLHMIGIAIPNMAVTVGLPALHHPEVVNAMRGLLEDGNVAKVYHNAFYDRCVLEVAGFNVKGQTHDTFYAHHVCYPELAHDLQNVVTQFQLVPPWKSTFGMLQRNAQDQQAKQKHVVAACTKAVDKLQVAKRTADDARIALEDAQRQWTPELLKQQDRVEQRKITATIRSLATALRGAQRKLETIQTRATEVIREGEVTSSCAERLGRQTALAEGIYNAQDALYTARLHPRLLQEMARLDIEHVYRQDIPTAEVARLMTMLGVPVDAAGRQKAITALYARVTEARTKLATLTNRDDLPNINKPAEIAEFLTSCGLSLLKRTRTGKVATSKIALEDIRETSPIVDTLLDLRSAEHDASIYGPNLPVDAFDGRLHADWKTNKITGRWSSSPNVQNWFKEVKGQISPIPGRMLVAADMAQAELRSAALLGDDKWLLEVFANNQDPHRLAAMHVFEKFETFDPTTQKALREVVKPMEYGGIYGALPSTVYKNLRAKLLGYTHKDFAIQAKVRAVAASISLTNTEQALERILKLFAGVTAQRQWWLNQVTDGKHDGPLGGEIKSGFLGRRRVYPFNRCSQSEIFNFPIQASIAELVNRGLLRLVAALAQQGLLLDVTAYARSVLAAEKAGQPCPTIRGLGAFPVLQVHDQLVIECDDEDALRVRVLLEEAMLTTVTHTCLRTGNTNVMLFPAEAKIGRTWAAV